MLHLKEFEGNPNRRIAWLIITLTRVAKFKMIMDSWNALCEQKNDFLRQVWEDYFQNKNNDESFIYILGKNYNLLAFSPSECKIIENFDNLEKLVPDPGADWAIDVLENQ